MRHFVYETKNCVNGMLYRGKRSSDCIDDGYLGSGTLFLRALKKYGTDSFERKIIFEAFDEDSAFWAESQLVDQEWCDRKDTYNITPGGKGISSQVAREINIKRVQNGTHNFLDSEFQSRNAKRRVEKGTHPFQGESGSSLATRRNLASVQNGTHPFLDIQKQTERVRKRVYDGTHNWLNSAHQKELADKRVADGTHNLLGKGMMTVIDMSTGNYIRIHKDEYYKLRNIRYKHPRMNHHSRGKNHGNANN